MSRTYKSQGRIPAGKSKQKHKKDENRKARHLNKKIDDESPKHSTVKKTIYYMYYW